MGVSELMEEGGEEELNQYDAMLMDRMMEFEDDTENDNGLIDEIDTIQPQLQDDDLTTGILSTHSPSTSSLSTSIPSLTTILSNSSSSSQISDNLQGMEDNRRRERRPPNRRMQVFAYLSQPGKL